MRAAAGILVGVSVITLGGLIVAACSSKTCADDATCDAPDTGTIPDGSTLDGEAGIDAPPGCDLTKEPKDSTACVDDAVGVFVDATGSDGNAGTKSSPVKTIGTALAKLGPKPRVYVCDGTYDERVKLTSGVSVYGGFACGTWTWTGAKAKVSPQAVGYALEVNKVSSAVVVADVSLTAAPGTDASVSSIAAFVNESSNVKFLRVELTAGAGFEGKQGAAGTTGTPDRTLDGNSGNMTTPGPARVCTCTSGGFSTGGGGGAAPGVGQTGSPSHGGVAPTDGAGGLASTSCAIAEPNGVGNVGADAPPAADGTKISSLGALASDGWSPKAGESGLNGAPGQGGGGGGGQGGAGGGGGCGGCGGSGGKGGGGGGGSIALVSHASTVTLSGSTLTTSSGGKGGTGGGGGSGGGGGGGAVGGAPNGCGGGDGGKGGDGGAGGGGAGGVSVGVLYKGPKPTLDATTVTTGSFGTKGTGGKPGTNDGIDGQKADTLEVP